MKYTLTIGLIIASFYGFAQKPNHKPAFKLPAGISRNDYLPNKLIVKFTNNASPKSSSAPGKLSLKSVMISQLKPVFSEAKPQVQRKDRQQKLLDDAGLDRIYEIKFEGSKAIEDVIDEVLQNPDVVYAEPQYIYHTGYTPNDAFFANGQEYLQQIKAPQAWDLVRNSSDIIIAIVDSGSDLDHEDLAANIYINTADPVNGQDDDNDGYTDNNKGWDFVGESATNLQEDNDPDITSDSTDHGVHVSGIAGAVSDNGIGVSSVAFNPKLLIVKVGSDDNETAIYRGYEGIKYAADHGAKVINCSWGGPGGGAYGRDIINYAIAKGCLVVAAAGNDGADAEDYPAAYDGVLAVANVRNNDVKNSLSNYNIKVDISAPGTGIYNTVNANEYANYSGTSMSTPMVSGAAALVKSKFPEFDMLQVAEQLRVTADAIDDKNAAYAGKLGKGRLNVYRALTEAQPSVRNQKLTVVDKGNGAVPAGDTVRLFFDLKNFLAPATGFTVDLETENTDAQILTRQLTVGTIATAETKTQVGPFLVFIKESVTDNEEIEFKLNYSSNANTYNDIEYFSIPASLDYRNINVNQIATTVTSNGRVGYNSPNAGSGVGFVYKNRSLLFEAALMIGNSATQVSNNSRSGEGESDAHFIKKIRLKEVENDTTAFTGQAEFDDSGSPNPLSISIKHRQLAFAEAPDDKYVIVEYEMENRSGRALNNIYAGLFTDWDIDEQNRDITKYDVISRMGYVTGKFGGTSIGAVKLLSAGYDPLYYPLSYQVAGDPLQNGTFTSAEKFQTLSSGIKANGLGDAAANGLDVMFVSGAGPYNIPVNGKVKIAFAFIAGDDLPDVEASAAASQKKYDLINNIRTLPAGAGFVLKQNYPNPAADNTTIEFSIPQKAATSLDIYSIAGKKVRAVLSEELNEGTYRIPVDVSGLASGIYLYKLRYGNKQQVLKMNVVQ